MSIKVLLLDIEGTTTPIAFVYDVLFPYAREHVGEFLRLHFEDPGVVTDRLALADQAERDIEAGVPGARPVDPESLPELVANVQAQMDADRKTTCLKALQGKIWRAGYADGSLQGVVYDDVARAIRATHEAAVRVCIYSSGSIAAQRLLFENSTAGDLSPFIAAYFDTTTGPKKDAESYAAIASSLGVAPSEILFCTDSLDEALAADRAGVGAVILDRPGNHPVEPHTFEVWETLTPVRAVL